MGEQVFSDEEIERCVMKPGRPVQAGSLVAYEQGGILTVSPVEWFVSGALAFVGELLRGGGG